MMGIYRKIECCTKCDWYDSPLYEFTEICPECGCEELELVIGRYELEQHKYQDVKIIIGFVRGKRSDFVTEIKL